MGLAEVLNHAGQWLGSGLLLAAAGYALASLWAVRKPLPAQATAGRPAVSVLKPLHGAEPRLYENLFTVASQLREGDQLLCGVREAHDPAIAVVQALQAALPGRDIQLVLEPRVHGSNLKVSNLLNLQAQARHDWLVLADSDISVPPGYLDAVVAPLADPGVGVVTCLYHGVAQASFWSRLGCLFIDDWFAPSVRLSHALGSRRFAFGSTIALRADSLAAIGGLATLADTLADDFWLGELTRRAGLRTVLSPVWVGTEVSETRFATLVSHELRWLRTIRAIAPAGFFASVVCFTWPLALLGLALAPTAPNLALAVLALGARVLRWRRGAGAQSAWLMPVRDVLLLLEWAVALTGWRVKWRGQVMHARKDGPIRYS